MESRSEVRIPTCQDLDSQVRVEPVRVPGFAEARDQNPERKQNAEGNPHHPGMGVVEALRRAVGRCDGQTGEAAPESDGQSTPAQR